MKKFGFITLFVLLSLFVFGWFDVQAWVQSETDGNGYYGTLISLIPPIVAIGLALITREVVLSLFAGIWIGALFLVNLNPFAGTAESLDLLVNALVNADHIAIIVFSMLLGGMVGVMSRGGGTRELLIYLENLPQIGRKGNFFHGRLLCLSFLMIMRTH